MTMHLYEFMLPVTDNSGRPTKQALADWEASALAWAGGFTLMSEPTRGAWRDPGTGKVYVDYVRIYRVGCTAEQHRELLADAFALFSDQAAIFCACVGTAEVHMRPAAAA